LEFTAKFKYNKLTQGGDPPNFGLFPLKELQVYALKDEFLTL
jgi:hypothetical protein